MTKLVMVALIGITIANATTPQDCSNMQSDLQRQVDLVIATNSKVFARMAITDAKKMEKECQWVAGDYWKFADKLGDKLEDIMWKLN